MFIDARSLAGDEIIETDVCIVGSGPAGLAIACEYIDQGFQVCLLESGSFELPDEQTVSLAEVETKNLDFEQVKPHRRNRRWGGNSSYWAVEINPNESGLRNAPLTEIDFEKRDWLPYSGWPFDRNHLMPYYERAQTVFGMGKFAYEASDWITNETPELPFKGDRIKTRMFQFSPGNQFFIQDRERIRHAANVTTYLYANALEFETDDQASRVTHVRVGTLTGVRFRVAAKYVIVTAGGVGSAHLLLLSNKVQPNGLGNQNDLVGRFFMDHPIVHGGRFYPSNRKLINSMALYDMRYVNGVTIMGALGLTDEAMRREKLLNICAWLFPRSKYSYPSVGIQSIKELITLRAFKRGLGNVGHHVLTVVKDLGGIADSLYSRISGWKQPFWSTLKTGGWSNVPNKDKVYDLFDVLHLTEQIPHPDNRLLLSDRLDPLGRRMVRVESQWRDEDIQGIKRAQKLLAEEIAKSGLGRFEIEWDENDRPILSTPGASHHLGTTRMHDDPQQGVVDSNCKVHGVSNLYIASGSVFPTGGYANPTLTIVAIALRVADHVKAKLSPEAIDLLGAPLEEADSSAINLVSENASGSTEPLFSVLSLGCCAVLLPVVLDGASQVIVSLA
jgi:choline dehydrogenase-like flavoprotein